MEYKGKKIVVCFTSSPVSPHEFFASKDYLFGQNKELHQRMMIGVLFDKKVHMSDEYSHEIVWFKYLDDDLGLFGVDSSELSEHLETE